MLYQRFSNLVRLPVAERRLALRAVAVLFALRIALRLLPFARVRAMVDRFAGHPAAIPNDDFARAVRRAVDRAVRTVPGSACLARALTADLMLRRSGVASRMTIGVALGGQRLDAHAWVESAGVLVTGGNVDLSRYRALNVFSTDDAPVAPR